MSHINCDDYENFAAPVVLEAPLATGGIDHSTFRPAATANVPIVRHCELCHTASVYDECSDCESYFCKESWLEHLPHCAKDSEDLVTQDFGNPGTTGMPCDLCSRFTVTEKCGTCIRFYCIHCWGGHTRCIPIPMN